MNVYRITSDIVTVSVFCGSTSIRLSRSGRPEESWLYDLPVGSTDDSSLNADEIIEGLAGVAEDLLYVYGDVAGVHPINTDQLPAIIRAAMHKAWVAHDATATLSDHPDFEWPTPTGEPPPYLYYVAVHVACGLIRNTANIFPEKIPAMSAQLRGIGASGYVQGWAFMLAIYIADKLEDSIDDVPLSAHRQLTHEFLSTLDELVESNLELTQRRIAPLLVDCLLQRSSERAASEAPPEPPTPTAPEPPTEPELKPAQEPDPDRRRWGYTIKKFAVPAVVLVLIGALLGAAGDRLWQQADSKTGSATTTSTTTVIAPPPPLGPEPALTAPTLANVTMQLFAYPQGGKLDSNVVADPERSTRARAIMSMGGLLEVEIHLAVRTGASRDRNEHFFIGFWPSGLMTLQPGTSKVIQHGLPELGVSDLKPAPTTSVDNLDPNATTVYKLEVAAIPQPAVIGASPGSGYFCGFNTQAVNAIVVSNKYPNTQIIATLPVSVLRTSDCS
jgi:hypothetical protein